MLGAGGKMPNARTGPLLARLPACPARAYGGGMTQPSNLDNPHVSSHAWQRYRRLMLWMAGVALVTTIVAIFFLQGRNPGASIHLYIAAAAGVFISVLLGSALMGLVFLSSGTGHDEAIEDRLEEERNRP
jgi:hypothetical protein